MDSWDIIDKLNKEYDDLYNECESFKKQLKKSNYLNCLRDIEFLYRDCLEMEICWIQDPDYEDDKKSLLSTFVNHVMRYKDDDESFYSCHIRHPCLDKTIDELEDKYETLKKALN